jgi:hypothetical protein
MSRIRHSRVGVNHRRLAIEPLEERRMLNLGDLLQTLNDPSVNPGQESYVGYAGAADTTPPTVTATSPSLAAGSLGAGVTSLSVTFSEPVVGGDVLTNYQLQSLGPDALLGTADDTIISLSPTYAGNTATLSFAALPESVYRLTVRVRSPTQPATASTATGTALPAAITSAASSSTRPAPWSLRRSIHRSLARA